jgi:hypothetical protein
VSKPTLKVTADFTQAFQEVIKSLRRQSVLVGVPADDNNRSEGDPIGNAGLLAIATFGSPARNIPSWDILGIGIRKVQKEVATVFKDGGKRVLSGGANALDAMYEKAGIIASTSCKKVLNTQEGVPPDRPTAATLAARKRFGFLGDKYWLVTGQLRNAITYVVKGR